MRLSELDRCELETFILGEKLGAGIHRDVYVYTPDPTLVVKVETGTANFANAKEWEVWNDLKWRPDVRKWLAPCVAISQSGAFLLQKRTTPITESHMPKRIPKFFTDEKVDNWGRLDNKIVCHDYALTIRNFDVKLRARRHFET